MDESSRLHREVLDMEFLTRCGDGFLRCYHRAWIESPYSIAIAAIDNDGRIEGVLLGSVQPEAHFRAIVRRRGVFLAVWLLVGSVKDWRFAKELFGTRAIRYSRGLVRMLLRSLERTVRRGGRLGATDSGSEAAGEAVARTAGVGEITHVMVSGDAQGTGIGRALLEEARAKALAEQLEELVLVTPPEMTAGQFYEHLGWQQVGKITSRSGEQFLRYRLLLR